MEQLLMDLIKLSHAPYVNNQVKEAIENLYDKHKEKLVWDTENLSEFISLCDRLKITPDYLDFKTIFLQTKKEKFLNK